MYRLYRSLYIYNIYQVITISATMGGNCDNNKEQRVWPGFSTHQPANCRPFGFASKWTNRQHRWSKHVPRVQRLNLECILAKAVLRVQCWAEISNATTPVDSFAQINSVLSPCFVAEATVRVVYFGHEFHSNSTSPSWVLPGETSNCTEARGEGHVGGRGLAVRQPRSTLRMDCA